jgi:predicted ABC-type ATPase
VAEVSPTIIILAGPNGAGKTTAANALLHGYMGLDQFVNADDIARGLSGFDPDLAAVRAGRIMLGRMRELAAARESFAFETTLATRAYAPWLHRLRADGYRVGLFFLWLPTPEDATDRVRQRVRQGGHDIPEPVIRRRFARGLRNFFALYAPAASEWTMYDNSGPSHDIIAAGAPGEEPTVARPEVWTRLQQEHANG